jgi:multiple RNA-binding domain-containing protein 1
LQIESNAAEDVHPTRRRDATNDNDTSLDKKRKRDGEDKSQDPKLQEYLSLMGQSSKTRTWANDDDMAKPSTVTAPVINQNAQETTQTEELPSHPKKAKTEKPPVVETIQQPESMVIDKSGEEENQEEPDQDNSAEIEEAAPVSDADWLRSKTSRLLGLLDEEEQDEFDQHKAEAPADSDSPSSAGDKSPPVRSESRTEAIENIAPNMTDDDSEPQEAPEAPAPDDPNLDLIRNSARLFLRNLAYDTTEADLQPLFERFGKIEEVSHCSIFFSLFFLPYPPHSPRLAGF